MTNECVTQKKNAVGKDKCERTPEAGTQMCALCRELLLKTLNEIPDLYEACDAQLARQPGSQLWEKITVSASHSLPFDEAAATAKSDLLSVIATWAGLVTDEFRVPGPNRRDATRLTAFLRLHLDLLLAHPAAGSFADEVHAVAESAQQVAEGGRPRRIVVGSCVHEGCGAEVVGQIRPDDTTAHIACEHGHTWTSQEWLLITHRLRSGGGARHLGAQGGGTVCFDGEQTHSCRTLPTDLAALAAGVAPATIRQWASRGKLTRLGAPGRAEYYLCELISVASDGSGHARSQVRCVRATPSSGPGRP